MFDERCEEFALAPAARAVEPMRVAGAQGPPWDTPPARDSCGTMSWLGVSPISLVSLGLLVEDRSWPARRRRGGPEGPPRVNPSLLPGDYFFFPSGAATTTGDGGSTGPIPSFSRILFSISRATSGLSRSQAFEFSRPWPIRRSP